MLDGRRVLIVEEEFLVALDIQRILEEAGTEETVFARTIAEANAHSDRWRDFDLAIIAVGDLTALSLVKDLQQAGIAVVVTSADHTHHHGIAQSPGVPVVVKPFDGSDLLTGCEIALATNPPRP